jgi:hypothetical protein
VARPSTRVRALCSFAENQDRHFLGHTPFIV